MAPAPDEDVEQQLRDVITHLYSLQVQVKDYEAGTADAMTIEIKRLVQALIALTRSSRTLPIDIPADIIEYVENSRNPDIYTREFVELIQKRNQQLKGRSEAYAQFRDALAREMAGAIPSIRPEVERVVSGTGGGSVE